jgi:hypothetical protein
MRGGKMDHEKGRSLVWVLSQMRAMVEAQALERIEARLEQMGGVQATRIINHSDGDATRPAINRRQPVGFPCRGDLCRRRRKGWNAAFRV